MRYCIDTNLIIDAIDKKKPEAISKLNTVLMDEASEVFVNRLVYLETLRTVKLSSSKNFTALKSVFENFETLDINQAIYDQAIALSRYSQSKGITLKGKCAAIDFLHFMTAKYYQLEMLAYDGDMEILAAVYTGWETEQA
jgi:predicted nucleic acid-binding protein